MDTAKEVREAMVRVIESGGADGYAPSVGTEKARQAIANRYRSRFSVYYTASVNNKYNILLRRLYI